MNKYQKIIKNWEAPFNKETADAWNELRPKIEGSNAGRSRVVSFSWKPLFSVAAAAAVIVAIVMVWPKSRLILRQTAAGQTETIILPDQSVLTLNASSSISYNDDWSKERTLELDGQAFFEVKKGSNFSVVTDKGIVEVLGTSFDVFARQDQFKVECLTGKVRVSSGQNHVEITPGNKAELSGKALLISAFDMARSDWRVGEFVYVDEPIRNVFDELERQFNIKIVAPKIEKLYNGNFNNKSLNVALEHICLPMGLKFEIQPDSVVMITEIVR